ncbi:polyphosphate kinase [Cytophagaceae bacterium YF14B1]|uniref:Polyphosphate kinase n=1 Tax=Xanthocytophaga flava TaxID=3048013 RepID=A0AAE3U3P0_9BACT|nr:PPK2 family polyphosphate kinase [Xanthocytophaga flavus]MDJ1466248.1 polyphosphate kinase [Xanthocytophaga flavus]MDJ1478919.1 polyphosphate kinase [Xanthocytophaga flavus]
MSKFKNTDTRPPQNTDKETIKQKTEELLEQLREKQKILYAQGEYSLLVILQGLDASGKDGVLNDVFSGLNLLGVQVVAFKAPTEEESRHDFLWRIHQKVPGKGIIGIFNRSHYEDVLVPRVEKWIDDKTIKKRFKHINDFESLLTENNTVILKFYLHVSAEEQRERLTERMENRTKFWKHNDNDWQVATKRDIYLDAYEDIFEHCSKAADWNIVPADKNWYKNYIIAKATLKALEQLPLKYPDLK